MKDCHEYSAYSMSPGSISDSSRIDFMQCMQWDGYNPIIPAWCWVSWILRLTAGPRSPNFGTFVYWEGRRHLHYSILQIWTLFVKHVPFPLTLFTLTDACFPFKDTPAYLRHQLKLPLYPKYVANFWTSQPQFTLLLLFFVRRFFLQRDYDRW